MAIHTMPEMTKTPVVCHTMALDTMAPDTMAPDTMAHDTMSGAAKTPVVSAPMGQSNAMVTKVPWDAMPSHGTPWFMG